MTTTAHTTPLQPPLAGKVALVAGASRGIGAVTARAFAQAGAAVVLAARDQQALDEVAEDIRSQGGQALAVPTDVGDPAAVEQLVQQAVDTFDRLDVAFNNATDGPAPTPLAEIDPEDFDRAIRTNIRGTFLGMKYQIQAMLRAGGGAIVNMASGAGLQGRRQPGRLRRRQGRDHRPDQGRRAGLRRPRHPRERAGPGADPHPSSGGRR